MKIVRVLDNKPCYQLEKELQNQFMRYSGVKFLTLEAECDKNKVFYFNKLFTLEKNLKKIIDYDIDFYLDLDVVFNKNGISIIQDFINHKNILVGNIYYIKWKYTNISKVIKYIPKEYNLAIEELFRTNKRYSSMLIQKEILIEFFKFLKKINYREIVKNYYNKYLEEFLYSVFLHKKRMEGIRERDFHNLYLRKYNLAGNEHNGGYFHLETTEMLPFYKLFYKKDLRYKKFLPKVKKIISNLELTEKYKRK